MDVEKSTNDSIGNVSVRKINFVLLLHSEALSNRYTNA